MSPAQCFTYSGAHPSVNNEMRVCYPQANVDEAIRSLQARGIEVVGCAANVGKKEDLQKLVRLAKETYGAVDVLVSNAAVNPAAGLILDMPDSAIEKILDVNVKSAILLTKEARPHMSKVSMPQVTHLTTRRSLLP